MWIRKRQVCLDTQELKIDMSTKDAKILEDAMKKHSINSLDGLTKKNLLAIIHYAQYVGYDEGYDDGRKDGWDDAMDNCGY